jgi:hypothetical protein
MSEISSFPLHVAVIHLRTYITNGNCRARNTYIYPTKKPKKWPVTEQQQPASSPAPSTPKASKNCNPMDLHRRSQAAVERVVDFLAANTKTHHHPQPRSPRSPPTISANGGGVHVGNLTAQAMKKGQQGRARVSPSRRDGPSRRMGSRSLRGMRFDRGFNSPRISSRM